MKEKEKGKEGLQDSSIILNNEMLLSLEGWLKYIEGFTKGIQSAEKVNSSLVLDCIGEILDYMVKLKVDLRSLLIYCEKILVENEELKKEEVLSLPHIEIESEEEVADEL